MVQIGESVMKAVKDTKGVVNELLVKADVMDGLHDMELEDIKLLKTAFDLYNDVLDLAVKQAQEIDEIRWEIYEVKQILTEMNKKKSN